MNREGHLHPTASHPTIDHLLQDLGLSEGAPPCADAWQALLAALSAHWAKGGAPRDFYETLLHNLPTDIAVFDANHRYIFCNPAAIRNEEVRAWIVGKDDFAYCARRGVDVAVAEQRRRRFEQAVAQGTAVVWEEHLTSPAGVSSYHLRYFSPVFSPDGALSMMIGSGLNVTERKEAQAALGRLKDELEARVAARTAELERLNDELEARVAARTEELERVNRQLQHDAFHDALTGLPNRALFGDRLKQAIERARGRHGQDFAVLFLDSDRFKVVNDSLGHLAGDALLVALAARLKECLRATDTVARLGGDEFGVLLEPVENVAQATEVAERIRQTLRRPFCVAGQEVLISASIGVVPGNLGYDQAEDVLRDADIAMYRAKASGRAGHQVFTVEMRERARELMALESELRRAVRGGELRVHYQPIVAVDSGKPVGFEALARWQHPTHGLLSPADFIPIAEDTGLIVDLDRFVLREACLQLREWQRLFPSLPPLSLSVNVSGRSFAAPDLYDCVARTLRETGFDPRDLKLEITESVLMQRSENLQSTLEQLRQLGVQLQIDDFGTGYSSLGYLQHYPVDTLKIDRSFVDKMLVSAESAELVRTIISMARNLGVRVVAEGIEEVGQLEQLRALRCEYGQGYLLSKPLEAPAVSAFMAREPAFARA